MTMMDLSLKRTMQKIRRISSLLIVFLGIHGCTFSFESVEYRKAQRNIKGNSLDRALFHFSRILKKSPDSDLALESARTAARIATLQQGDFLRAVEFYRHIVIYSPEPAERKEAQQRIATIFFQNLNNYEQAIVEYNKLLKLPHSPTEAYQYRLNVARSYFQLSNFFQALVEVEELLEFNLNDDQLFEVSLMKGNIKLTKKELDQAVKIFTELKDQFPERSRAEHIGINIAVTYEELGDFAQAISILEVLKNDYPTPEFIELKIKRLEERQANQPGARGPVR